MKNIYVISDLHGRGKAFHKMLKKIAFSKEDQLYILGDVIDRGPDGVSLLRYIKEQENMTLLMGNHEDMMLKSFFGDKEEAWMETWMFNGGNTTLAGLGSLSKEEKDQLLDYVGNLALAKKIDVEGKKYFLVHAGLSLEEDKSMEEICAQTDYNDALWIREEFFDSPVILEETVVFGHTPTGAMDRYAKDLPEEAKECCKNYQIVKWNNRINIDCGAAHEKNLGCLRLNDLKEFYIEI